MHKKLIKKGLWGLDTSQLASTIFGLSNEQLAKNPSLATSSKDRKAAGIKPSIMGIANNVIDPLTSVGLNALGKQSDSLDPVIDTVANTASMFGPVGSAISLGIKGLNFADKALGKTTKAVNINSGISGYGGADLNQTSKQFRLSQTGARKKFERDLNKRKILASQAKLNTESELKKNQARIQSVFNTGMTNQTQLAGGNDFSVLTAKKGASLEDIRNYIKTRNIKKEVPQNLNLEQNTKIQKINEIGIFQNGGSVIPSGSLHKNKHNLEFINPELEGEVTKKGIPVISYAEKGDVLAYDKDGKTPKEIAEGGEVIQHAEIEAGEIIFNISLTKKLIELMNKGTNDDMIHAGKLLAREVMENTTDNTDIMKKMIDKANA